MGEVITDVVAPRPVAYVTIANTSFQNNTEADVSCSILGDLHLARRPPTAALAKPPLTRFNSACLLAKLRSTNASSQPLPA